METIAPHTLVEIGAWQPERLHHLRLGFAMEGGIEAGDLRQGGGVLGECADRCKVVRLM